MNLPPQLLVAAMRLRAASHSDWTDFLAALEQHRLSLNDSLVASTPDHLVSAQGYARHARDLVQALHKAPALFEQMQQSKATAP